MAEPQSPSPQVPESPAPAESPNDLRGAERFVGTWVMPANKAAASTMQFNLGEEENTLTGIDFDENGEELTDRTLTATVVSNRITLTIEFADENRRTRTYKGRMDRTGDHIHWAIGSKKAGHSTRLGADPLPEETPSPEGKRRREAEVDADGWVAGRGKVTSSGGRNTIMKDGVPVEVKKTAAIRQSAFAALLDDDDDEVVVREEDDAPPETPKKKKKKKKLATFDLDAPPEKKEDKKEDKKEEKEEKKDEPPAKPMTKKEKNAAKKARQKQQKLEEQKAKEEELKRLEDEISKIAVEDPDLPAPVPEPVEKKKEPTILPFKPETDRSWMADVKKQEAEKKQKKKKKAKK